MSVNAYLEAVVSGVKARLPKLRSIETHGGRFTKAELERFAVATPAARIACLKLDNPKRVGGGFIEWTAHMVCVLVAKDTGTLTRDQAALNMAETTALTVVSNDWGLENVHAADDPKLGNLYTSELSKRGVAFWAVEWTQRIRLIFRAQDECPLPTELYIGLSPDTGPDHIDDYVPLTEDAA